MKLLLKDFQTDAVAEFVKRLRKAGRDARDGDKWAVALSSPTGSGKTLMATAAIETLLQGDDDHAGDPEATFLWVSDQPELNKQTRGKMIETASALPPSRLVILDADFDRETFASGTVYFLNTQNLAKSANLVKPGDKRQYTLWQTLANTVKAKPGRFFVFIDEAHRGMTEKASEQKVAETIIQKFIKGSPDDGLPPVPLIAGISATPERFTALIGQTDRTSKTVIVDPADVRASGLLKEVIRLYHPDEDQPSDMTMLAAAAKSWKRYGEEWAVYCRTEGIPPVRPLFVVQVEDASATQPTKTSLATALGVIEEATGTLPNRAYAQAFQEQTKLDIGERELRYLRPSEIDADPDVQVVFFKTALNTGWDCPRAETMMSFRKAVDATLITQLVGRMVRTPLARRIDADEHLNTVALYLPHYDKDELKKVVERLTANDADGLPTVRVEEGKDQLTLARAPGTDEAFAALTALPSYVVPKSRKTGEVKRLMKLSRLLANDGLKPDGPEEATRTLLQVLTDEYERLKSTGEFKAIVEEKGKLDIRAVSLRYGVELDDDDEIIQIDIAKENLEDLYDAAGRKIGEGLHKAWWRQRVLQESTAKATAKLELFALAHNPEVMRRFETTAQTTVQAWLSEYRLAITGLPEADRQAYDEVRRLAVAPELSPLSYLASIEVIRGDRAWEKHLYTDANGGFPAKLLGWETQVIEAELKRPDTAGWLRNTDRKSWALCIPYNDGGEWKSLYPDFITLRHTPHGLTASIFEPHGDHLADSTAKAVGLAEYADKHGCHFDRIEMIQIDGSHIKRLNLNDEATRERVKGVQTIQHLRDIFSTMAS